MFHLHRGQQRAWDSARRFIGVIAGTQGGKSEFGPLWLWREIRDRGPGDYLAVAPMYPLMMKKQLPAFLRWFLTLNKLGKFTGGTANVFRFSADGERRMWGAVQDTPTQVFFGHAQDPDSLEAATAKGAWLDEAGQNKFRGASWEAIQRRLAINRGRALISTTPYNLGWLKTQFFDRWKAGDADYDVVRFESIDNPAFPREEWERAKRTLPRWKFNMFYRGLFERPAGMIYDVFDPEQHTTPLEWTPPGNWNRYLGLDFGGVNTAGVWFAEELLTQKYFAYREYHAGGRTAKEHAAALLEGERGLPATCVGGSKSEDQWRSEFSHGGLPVKEPDQPDVEVGIQRVYKAIKEGRFYVSKRCAGLLDELATYSRPIDDMGNPMEGIEDKELFHRLDATRYIVGWLERNSAKVGIHFL